MAVNVVARTCPCSIWDDSFTGPQDADTNAVEVGVKFRSDQAGYITGLRFYKTAGNTGTHVGHLWTAGGTQLAEATFTGEGASGWQQVSFDTPVAINANTTYVASYHAPNGHYTSISGFFAGNGVDSAPLHALADGVDGPNGIYKYGPPGGSSPMGALTPSIRTQLPGRRRLRELGRPRHDAADDQLPLSGKRRQRSQHRQQRDRDLQRGDEPGDDRRRPRRAPRSGIDAGPGDGQLRRGPAPGHARPEQPAQSSTTYTAKIKGGAGGVTDLAGNPLAADSTWTFTTAAPPPPPPDEGPGGPILVISTSANPFSRYYAEILRAGGP